MAEDLLLRVEDDSGSDESVELDETGLVDPCLASYLCKNSPTPCGRLACSKLSLPEHIAAYCEKQELIRDDTPISCDNAIVEKVMSNYIIAKEILSNLCWQDKMLCKHVCTTWRSAVNSLVREQFHSVDFVYNTQYEICGYDKLVQSDGFHNAPMAVLVFVNNAGSTVTAHCKDIFPCPCKTPCKEKAHSILDVVHQRLCAPKDCMLTVVTSFLTFMPLPSSVTFSNALRHYHKQSSSPFIGGVYIPAIPDVQFHVLNIKQKNRNTMNFQADFYDVVEKLAETRIFKGVLVYATEYYILQSFEGVMLLNYFKQLQPEIPFALAGCIIEDTIFKQNEIEKLIKSINDGNDYTSNNLISIGVFTVPKIEEGSDNKENNNFDMFSLVIQKCEWTKPKIREIINDFAKKVPQFEHSIAFKLSCIGRAKKHEIEQEYFRAAFPQTPLFGCYGNGELGINHPTRSCSHGQMSKRPRQDPLRDITYSYSTVFLYIGWGKIVAEPESPNK